MEGNMTPTQLMKHYKNNKSAASREIGCSRASLLNWIVANKIPKQWQSFIQQIWDKELLNKAKEESKTVSRHSQASSLPST
jgi:hypothetical protein